LRQVAVSAVRAFGAALDLHLLSAEAMPAADAAAEVVPPPPPPPPPSAARALRESINRERSNAAAAPAAAEQRAAKRARAAKPGLGRSVALRHHPSALYRTRQHMQCLHF
jgi:hypothetical protein